MMALFARIRFAPVLLVGLIGVVWACQPAAEDPYPVKSYFEGTLTIRAEVDSVQNYADIEVFIPYDTGDGVDTLGYVLTDSTGAFAMTVSAPERGVYPLFISRRGGLLKQDEIVIADGDSAALRMAFPTARPILPIRSAENAAWLAYRNTKALYDQSLRQALQQENQSLEQVEGIMNQTAQVLWTMRETYPGTVGADVAGAESVLMYSSRNDSMVVARAKQLNPDQPGFLSVGRAARRAEARLNGQYAALSLLDDMIAQAASVDTKAGLMTEKVEAYADSQATEAGIAIAEEIQQTYPDSEWSTWAERAVYALTTLQPGMTAPTFAAQTIYGDSVNTAVFEEPYVLSFMNPENPQFWQSLQTAQAAAYTSIFIVPSLDSVYVEVLADLPNRPTIVEDRSGHLQTRFNAEQGARVYVIEEGLFQATRQ
ncbi:MAG: hypothetical protein RhofKO_24320 [Rhodothermales bacterium]